MKKTLFVGAALMVAASAPASAADMYRREAGPSLKDEPVYTPAIHWTGFYLGVHAGGANGTDKLTDVDGWMYPKGRSFNIEDTAFIGGAQLGYNLQTGHLVLGIEGDIGHLGLSKRQIDPRYGVDNDQNAGSKQYGTMDTGLYGTVTGRVGIAGGNWLVYAKGGAAFLNADFTYTDKIYLGTAKTSETLNGWVVGGGLEYALSNNWSVKAEYQHFDFGTATARVVYPYDEYNFDNKLTVDAVTAGVNYKFGREGTPLK
jgi:outer membrane immunogenic protein